MTKERWRTVKAAPDYAVSDHGRIKRQINGRSWNARAGHIMWQRCLKEGYFSVGLWVDGKGKSFLVHVLVLLAFIGPKPSSKHQAAHWDNDEGNNYYKNLRWATPRENVEDKRRHGTLLIGKQNKKTRFSDYQVRQIRKLNRSGVSQADIARRFKTGDAYISRVCRNLRRQHVT